MIKILFQFLAMTLLAVNITLAADEIHWTITGKDSVTFDWRGAATENSIGYGLTSGNYTQVIATKPNPVPVSSSGPFWEAKLTGLKENARYYYKIGTRPERSFRTAPAPGSSDFNVYAQGNIGSTSTYFNMGVVQDLIASDLPDFVVGLGDLTLGNTDGKAAIDQHFNDIMMWSTQAGYMPVWGDRDTVSSSKENFKNYKGRFAVPNSQTSPGSPLAGGEDWYWFDYGNVRFITIPEPWTGARDNWFVKASTLMAQAQNDPNIKFIVTFVHRPAYSSGHFLILTSFRGMLDALGDTYSKYKLNVNAHNNNYERSFPQHGVTHVTVGTGGADLTQDGACLWLKCTKPSWTAFRAMHLGALKLHFTDSGIEGSFICGPAGGGINDVTCRIGSVIDSFVIGTLPVKPIEPIPAPNPGACNRTVIDFANITGGSDGWLYRVMGSLGTAADNSNNLTQSTLRLFENGAEIGPAHTSLSDLLNIGLGKFQHWSLPDGTAASLWFTASDNTDPRNNGKVYSYCTTADSTPVVAPLVAPPPVVNCTRTVIDVSKVTGGSDGWLYRFMGSLGTTSDNSNNPTQSTLRLFENEAELGPGHTSLGDLLNIGLGRFQHWSLPDGTAESLWFTASDNTDPRTNGKVYSYCATVDSPTVAPPPVSDCTQTVIDVTKVTGGNDGWLYRFMGSLGTTPDNSNNPTQSTLRLFENGAELGPGHTSLGDLLNIGLGRFQHWGLPDGTAESLWFTASDNTDPRANGRKYSYCVNGQKN